MGSSRVISSVAAMGASAAEVTVGDACFSFGMVSCPDCAMIDVW